MTRADKTTDQILTLLSRVSRKKYVFRQYLNIFGRKKYIYIMSVMKQSKGKGCLAEIIGFASPLHQQNMLPPSFILFNN